MSVTGHRAAKLSAAGTLLHLQHRAPGVYTRAGISICGLRRTDGAEFTVWPKYVTCPDCRRVVTDRRREAKVRFAAILESKTEATR